MSKTKNKSRSEVEYLRGVIRRLRAQVKYYKRRAHIPENEVEEEIKELLAQECTECGKGHMREHDFRFVIMKVCDVCGHQETTKKESTDND